MPINTAGINATVTVKLSNNTIVGTSSKRPVTLKSTARTINNLRDLSDVNEGVPEDGEALVYDAASDKYVTRRIELGDVAIDNINGGTF